MTAPDALTAGALDPGIPAPSDARASGSELELLRRLRAGDERAFEELVSRHAGRMLAVARRYLRDEDEARDAVQDAFLSAFRALPAFEGGSRLATWLHRIVVNAALMRLRRQKRRPEIPIDTLLPSFLEDGHHAEQFTEWLPADALLVRGETRAAVRAAIDRLPATYRTVLLVRDIDGLDTSEAAALLRITPNAVKIRLHRARQALRTLLDPVMRAGA